MINESIPLPADESMPINPAEVVEYELRVFKFAVSYYLTIQQRSSIKSSVPAILNLLKSYINKNEHCAEWIIREFCNNEIIDENFLQCSNKDIRKLNTGLLYCAMLKRYPFEKDRILAYWADPANTANNTTSIANFALVLITRIFDVKAYQGNSSQYFQLFARIASLGPEIREFLLKAKLVGRLMEYFFDEYSPHKELFRDMTGINPIFNLNPDIGLPTKIDKKQQSQLQELLEKKRMKQLSEAKLKCKNLFEAVHLCIMAYRNGEKKSPFETDMVNFVGITQQEKDLFFPEHKFIKLAYYYGTKNRAANFMSRGYIHFSWNDREAFNELLNVVIVGLNENDHDAIKQYLTLHYHIVLTAHKADREEQRFERAMKAIIEVMENNQHFYKFTEAMYEYIFKLSAAVPKVTEWFKANQASLAWLSDWSQQVQFPIGSQVDVNAVRLYKKRQQYQQYPQNLKNEAFKNSFLRNARLDRINKLLEGKVQAQPDELANSIADFEDYKFTVDEHLELYYKRSDFATPITVVEVLDELIRIRFDNYNANDAYGQQFQWIATDSDKIQKLNTYEGQYRVKYVTFLENQHLKQNRQQTVAGGAVASGKVR